MATNLNESIFNTPNAQRLIKKYSNRLGLIESALKTRGLDMSYERKLATATCLENTARQIRALEAVNGAGATQPGNIGQYKRYAIDMVGTIIPNLIDAVTY